MAYADTPLFLLKSPEMIQIIQQLQFAVNFLDETNFPNKVNADAVLKANSATGSNLLINYSTPLKKLAWQEWPIPLVIPVQPATTTSSLDCGGFFLYDPAKFPGGTWYLEAAMQVTSGGTATIDLKAGVTVVGSVSTTNTTWTVLRSAALTMPQSQTALTVTLKSSSSSYTASLWAARLIYVS
ncbi:hypothetical protein [Gelria sp. Kuro-4]|uniref:hypothetical protein n=1 Tax=Gelria sp. Kuro-4 TaxID=2796927 RepID=UPI001BED8011|nr:hypothetical protein [Gelria sp. Kuro-4]BCV23301.1 hypothetical protein kuro4_00740 [Gelria sp. Kuro-4]